MTTDSSAASARLALKGDLLDFTGAPQWGRVDDPAVRFRPDHWLLVEDGRIVGAQAEDPGEGWVREDHSGRLLLPGFVDTHVHSPQLDVIASFGTELLDWLNTYTFPAELRYMDPEVARYLYFSECSGYELSNATPVAAEVTASPAAGATPAP